MSLMVCWADAVDHRCPRKRRKRPNPGGQVSGRGAGEQLRSSLFQGCHLGPQAVQFAIYLRKRRLRLSFLQVVAPTCCLDECLNLRSEKAQPGIVPASHQLRFDLAELGPQPLRDREAAQPEVSGPGLPADMREAEEVERLGPTQTPRWPPPGGVPPELDQPGLVR